MIHNSEVIVVIILFFIGRATTGNYIDISGLLTWFLIGRATTDNYVDISGLLTWLKNYKIVRNNASNSLPRITLYIMTIKVFSVLSTSD